MSTAMRRRERKSRTPRGNWDRAELQPIIEAAVKTAIAECEVPGDIAHTRRLCRCLLRVAADLGQRKGCSLEEFYALSHECFMKAAVIDVCGMPMIVIEGGDA